MIRWCEKRTSLESERQAAAGPGVCAWEHENRIQIFRVNLEVHTHTQYAALAGKQTNMSKNNYEVMRRGKWSRPWSVVIVSLVTRHVNSQLDP
jgi:hypothetical protein